MHITLKGVGEMGYEIRFIRQDDGECAPGVVSETHAGADHWWLPLNALDTSVSEETDLYTVLHPDFRPESLKDEIGFITGGMGSYQGRPVSCATTPPFLVSTQPTTPC
jgi:hypothetical protein